MPSSRRARRRSCSLPCRSRCGGRSNGATSSAYQAALDTLPAEQRREVELAIAQAMRAAQPDPRERFDALLRDIARVATGDAAPRQPIEAELKRLEQGGWMLREPVRRIWAGERDAAVLVAGLDEQDAALVERVLELITLIE